MKPSKPKRVSSVLTSCAENESNLPNHDEDTSVSEMGSSSSLQRSSEKNSGPKKNISSPKFRFEVTDVDSTQHRTFPQDVSRQTHNILLDEFNKIKHSSDQKLKKSTFKADLHSPIVLSRNYISLGHPDNSELRKAFFKGSNPAIFHSRYEFHTGLSKNDLNRSLSRHDITKPMKVKYDTTKYQQSDSPGQVDNSSVTTNDSTVSNSFTNHTDSSSRSNSVSDLFHRSKSRVRNSLRNLKFYARNLSSEEKPVDVNQPTPSCDLLPLPDNRDIDSFSSVSTDWLDQSFPSDNTDSVLSNKFKLQNNRTALPVNVPKVRQPMTNALHNRNLITKPKTHDLSPMTYEHTIHHDSEIRIKKYDNSVPANLQTDIISNFTDPKRPSSTHPTRPTTLNVKADTSEHESIALLDEVIEGHSQNLTQTSFVSMQTGTTRISGDMQLTPHEEKSISVDIKPIVSRGMSVREVLSHENISAEISPNKIQSTITTPSSHRVSSASFSSNQIDDDSFDSCESFSSESRFEDQTGEKQSKSDSQILTNNDQIRKTAWLFLKPLLIAKRRKVELATKRIWQKYWVNLRGGHLLFYDLEAKGQGSEDPVLTLPVDGAMVQAIPEHAKRENVFCLSTEDGSTFLMQASSRTEVTNFIQILHLEAASLFARKENNAGNESTMTKRFIRCLLLHDIEKRKREIEMDEKMKKMADLQATLVSDVKSRRAISDQVLKWVENLEMNHVYMYRNRCYISSLDGDEPPSAHNALASVCKSSKQLLNSFKLFNISSLYALVVSKQLNCVENVSSTATTPRKKLSSVGVIRSGSFNSKHDITVKPSTSSVSDEISPSKSKMANIFASLRGFDTWKGPGTKSKKHHRSSVASVLSAFMTTGSVQSNTKETNDSISKNSNGSSSNKTSSSTDKKWTTNRNSNDVDLQMFLGMEEYPSAELMSEDDNIDEVRNSSVGSLDSLLLAPPDEWSVPHGWNSSTLNVSLPLDDMVTITTTENMTFKQLLEIVCQRKQLDSSEFYLSIKNESEEVFENTSAENWCNASEDKMLSEVKFSNVKVTKKQLFSVEINKKRKTYGLTFTPKVICRYLLIENVTPGGASEQCGLRTGNEVLMINGELTVYMSQNEVNEIIKNSDKLRFLVRTCISDMQSNSLVWWIPTENETRKNSFELMTEEDKHRKRIEHLMAVTEEYLRNIVVPPPPVVSKLQPSFIRSPFSSPMRTVIERNSDMNADDIINLLIIPPPTIILRLTDHENCTLKTDRRTRLNDMSNDVLASDDLIDNLLKKSEEVTAFCRQVIGQQSTNEMTKSQSENGDIDDHRQKSCVSKIQKVLNELQQTEIAYVQDIECLLGRYLEPLCSDVFPSSIELTSLMNSVDGMLKFQKKFLKDLAEAMMRNEESELFCKKLSSVPTVFLKYSAQFKLYAVFSTCHSVAREILDRERTSSTKFQDFLDARNPKRQHASTLESYLIKPIQRVLKYPLLLREILILSESLEIVSGKVRRRLKAALISMIGVARHINDFQTVHDEFGNDGLNEIMKQAMAKIKEEFNEIHVLSVIDLLCHCTTRWLNNGDELRKTRKPNVNEVLVFVFRSAVVLLCRGNKTKDKKKGAVTTPQQDSSSLMLKSCTDFSFFKVFLGSDLSVRGRCPGVKNTTHCFMLCHSEKKYILLCENHEVKKRVVKSIEYLIMNAKKNNVANEDSADSEEDEVMDEAKIYSDNEGSASSSSVSLEISLDSSLNSEDYVQLKTSRDYFYKPNFKVSPRSLCSTTSQHGAAATFISDVATEIENLPQINKSRGNFENKRPRSANIMLESVKNIEYLKSTKLYSNNDLFFSSAPSSPIHPFSETPYLNPHSNSKSSDKQSFNNLRYNMIYGVSSAKYS